MIGNNPLPLNSGGGDRCVWVCLAFGMINDNNFLFLLLLQQFLLCTTVVRTVPFTGYVQC